MCVCVCVCVCRRTCVCMHVCVFLAVFVCMHVSLCLRVCVFLAVCVFLHVYKFVLACGVGMLWVHGVGVLDPCISWCARGSMYCTPCQHHRKAFLLSPPVSFFSSLLLCSPLLSPLLCHADREVLQGMLTAGFGLQSPCFLGS